jgi:hypothetical protein
VIAFDCLAAYAPASLEDSGQLGGAWAHDCAVGDEEVAEDQDESCCHGWWVDVVVAVVASCLIGLFE